MRAWTSGSFSASACKNTTRRIRYQAARSGVFAKLIDCRQLRSRGQGNDSIALCMEERISGDEQCGSMLLDELGNRWLQLLLLPRGGNLDAPIDGTSRFAYFSHLLFGCLIVWIYEHTDNSGTGVLAQNSILGD